MWITGNITTYFAVGMGYLHFKESLPGLLKSSYISVLINLYAYCCY